MSIHLATLAFLLAAAALPAADPATRPGDPSAKLEAGLPAHAAGAPRAVWASGQLLGQRYRLSPLGEGTGIDPDPLFRLDAFDCVTFVETAIALGNARSLAEARLLLDDVRYQAGPPDFQRRNHYMEAQWLPVNARKGWVEDVTLRLGGGAAVPGEKVLTAETWRAAERAGRLVAGLEPERRPVGSYPLPIIPLGRLAEVAPRIPDGTILLLVRADRPSRPYRITHLGLVVTLPGGGRALRHASDAPGAMKVRDEPLAEFVARNARLRGWPVAGVSLYSIRDGAARAGELLGAPR
jgi:hypothetical protein